MNELKILDLIFGEPSNESKMSNGSLQLCPIQVNQDYKKKWNIDCADFMCLTLNGDLLRPTLYRIGGMNYGLDLSKNKYFMLLKYVEAYYRKDILKNTGSTDPKHLEGRWCILDKDGNEKIEFEKFESVYLTKDSCIYSIDGRYHNIETGEFYGRGFGIESDEFLFLDNKFHDDKSKRGVLKINKKDGTLELFKNNS